MVSVLERVDRNTLMVIITFMANVGIKCMVFCWRALARQQAYSLQWRDEREREAKSVGCMIVDMRSRLCFLYPSIQGCL